MKQTIDETSALAISIPGITGVIINAQLQIFIEFDENYYKLATMERFVQEYKDALFLLTGAIAH